MVWCFRRPAVLDEVSQLSSVRQSKAHNKSQRLRTSEDSAFETQLVGASAASSCSRLDDGDWGQSPSRDASFCSLSARSDGGAVSSGAGISRQSSASSAVDVDAAPPGPGRATTLSLGPHSAAETAIARRAALAELEAQQRHSALESQMVEPLAGHQRYRKLKNVQRGAASNFVQLALNLCSGERSAVKFVEVGDLDAVAQMRRLLAHRACNSHPNIVQLQEVFLTPGYLAIATEYADGGRLSDFQRRFENAGGMDEAPARALFQQMVAALGFCHRRGVTLGGFDLDVWLLDRSPARPILRQQSSDGQLGSPVTRSASLPRAGSPSPLPMARKLSLSSGKYTVKLADFGAAELARCACPSCPPSRPADASATAASAFCAPEVQQGAAHDRAAADAWSLGVCLHMLLMGAPPAAAETLHRAGSSESSSGSGRRVSPEPQLQFSQHVSSGCREVLSSLLEPLPQQRASVEDVLSHLWFTQDLSAELSTINSRLLADAPHGAAWPPLAAVALAAPQHSPETLRQLALGSGCCHHADDADNSSDDEGLRQDFRQASAPLPKADAVAAALAADAQHTGEAATQQQPPGQPSAGWLSLRQSGPVPGSRSADFSRARPQLQRVVSGKEAPAESAVPPPLQTLPLQRIALEARRGRRSVQLPRRAAAQTNVLAQLEPQRSCGSAGSIQRRTSCDLGLDYGSPLDAGRRRSLASYF